MIAAVKQTDAKSPSAVNHQRRAEHFAKTKHGTINDRSLTPEKTPAGREHVRLFKAWVLNMNRETFAAFIRSPYC